MGEKVSIAKRICVSLQSGDRKIRKNAYVELEKFLSEQLLSEEDLRDVFNETHMYTLNGMRDKAETVREQAITFINFLIVDKLPLNDYYLTYTFPVIVERIGTVELVEDSEEIRLQLLQLTEAIVVKYSKTNQLKPFLGDCILILAESVKDKYPLIKELSCRTMIRLAEALPRDFHKQAETLIKPTLTCLTHQRFKVRVEAIKALGEIIMHSSCKGLEDVLGPLAEKLFDQIPLVRRTVAQVAARWLLSYRDRYSFFAKILPLLLTGLNDEVEETRVEAHQLWQKVGLQYQEENEKDFKNQLDYLTTVPKYYPEKFTRPNIGCRALVQRNVGKIAPALSKELLSWQNDVRFRCSQLLCSIVLLAEEGLTMHLQELLPAMYSASRDDDSRVVENIVQASEILGLFVPVNTWTKLVLPAIEDGAHYGHLMVLAGLIRGTPKEYFDDGLDTISKLLAEDYVCSSRKKQYQIELLNCVKALTDKCDNLETIGYNLFKISVTLLALRNIENQAIITANIFNDFRLDVWSKYTAKILNHINKDCKTWTKVTDQYCIFSTVLLECKQAFGDNLDVIGDILTQIMNEEADAEQKLNTLYVLSEVFTEKHVIFANSENVTGFLEKIVRNIFVPCLVWHAGSTAEAIRTMAASCLKFALLPSPGIDLFACKNTLREVLDKLIPLLLSLVEDASYRSRQLGMECLLLLKQNACGKDVWTIDDLIKIYPEILKRFDDPTEKVRLCALMNFSTLLEQVPDQFKEPFYRAHHELIIDTLLTHFDDDDENVQKLVFDCLLMATAINKDEASKKLRRHKKILRNQIGCDKLIQHLELNQ